MTVPKLEKNLRGCKRRRKMYLFLYSRVQSSSPDRLENCIMEQEITLGRSSSHEPLKLLYDVNFSSL